MQQSHVKILVWDVPTRVFHWSMVICFAGAWLSAESERWRLFHVTFGYTMLGLVAFRLVWGFAGSRYAKFSEFLAGPQKIKAYVTAALKGEPIHYVGHNPLGALAIVMILVLVAGIGLTGYVSYNELNWFKADSLHEVLSNVLMLVVIVHVLGVVISSKLHQENLLKAMVTGHKVGGFSQSITRNWVSVGVCIALCVAAFWIYQFK